MGGNCGSSTDMGPPWRSGYSRVNRLVLPGPWELEGSNLAAAIRGVLMGIPSKEGESHTTG